MFCRQWTLIKTCSAGKRLTPLKCRSWGCEYCAPWRQKQLWGQAMSGNPTTFITLTVNPAIFSSPAERARELVRAWRLTRAAMKRRWKLTRIPFLAVFEKTQRGEPHLHILARLPFMAQAWLSAQMQRLIGAPVVDIRRVRNVRDVARYVSKYVSKEPQMWEGCKRYWSSLDWRVRKRPRAERSLGTFVMWDRAPHHISTMIGMLYRYGWDLHCEGDAAYMTPPKRGAPSG